MLQALEASNACTYFAASTKAHKFRLAILAGAKLF